jgi:hypothetical protein
VAVRVQVPAISLVTTRPETVHTLVVELETTTGLPVDVAVALAVLFVAGLARVNVPVVPV